MTTLELQNCEWNDATKVSDNCGGSYEFKSLGKREKGNMIFVAPGEKLPPKDEL